MYTIQPLARFSYLAIRPLVLLNCLLTIGILPVYSAAVPRTSSGNIPGISKTSVVGGAAVKSFQYNPEKASDDVASLPTVVTTSISDIHLDSAVAHASVTSPGDSPVIDWGFVWSTSENPTIGVVNNTVTKDGNPIVSNVQSCRYLDSLELVTLYYATGGPNWFYTWDLSTPINTWYGVSLNGEGCVTSISLPYNNLVGTIFDFQMLSLINV